MYVEDPFSQIRSHFEVVLYVYVQSCNLSKAFREKIVLEEVYATIVDQLCLSVW